MNSNNLNPKRRLTPRITWQILIVLAATISLAATRPSKERFHLTPKAYEDSINNAPDNATSYLWAKRFARAYPENARAHFHVGTLSLYTKGKPAMAESEKALRKALKLGLDEGWMEAWAYARIAYIEFATGRDSLARVHAEKALSIRGITKNCRLFTRRMLVTHRASDKELYKDWRIYRSEHFRFHAHPSFERSTVVEIMDRYENAFAMEERFWKATPPDSIDVYLYASEADIERIVGRRLHWAEIEKNEIHTTPRATTAHEMTHLFAYAYQPSNRSPLLQEGIATYFAIPDAQTFDRRLCGKLPEKNLRQIDREQNKNAAFYATGASLVAHIIKRFGSDKFVELYADTTRITESVAHVLGLPLDRLEKDWRQYIERICSLIAIMENYSTSIIQGSWSDSASAVVDSLFRIYGISSYFSIVQSMNLRAHGKNKEAEKILRAMINFKGELPLIEGYEAAAHLELGHLLASSGRIEEARREYLKARAAENSSKLTEKSQKALCHLLELDAPPAPKSP